MAEKVIELNKNNGGGGSTDNKFRVAFSIMNYGNQGSYFGFFGLSRYGVSFSRQTYRETSYATLSGATATLVLPSAASGGTATFKLSGSHSIKVIENTLPSVTLPATFSNTLTISGWTGSGNVIFEID